MKYKSWMFSGNGITCLILMIDFRRIPQVATLLSFEVQMWQAGGGGLCDSDNELADLINSQTGSGVSRRPKRIRDKTKKSRKFRDKHCGPLPGYGPPSPHCLWVQPAPGWPYQGRLGPFKREQVRSSREGEECMPQTWSCEII